MINVKTVRLTLALMVSFLALALHNARAELKWEQTAIELHPALGEKQTVGHFKYENIGTTPVRIKSARSSCGCTVAQSQKDDVQPGQKGEITATFTIGDRIGIQAKAITVETDDPAHPVTQLMLKTVIPQMLTIAPTFVYWTVGEETKPKTIFVKADKDFHARNLTVTSSSPEFAVKVESSSEGQWKIQVEPKETTRAMGAALTIRPDIPKDSPKSFSASVGVTGGPVATPPTQSRATPTVMRQMTPLPAPATQP
jgi:Protein of unknown function (DUF1573)